MPVGRLILVRHGQSLWNVTDAAQKTTARFTGWANIGLTQQGRRQARAAGMALRGTRIDCAVCSLLDRSKDSLHLMLQEMGLEDKYGTPTIPTIYSWRLNERSYGALVGLSKEAAEQHFGPQKLGRWRHGWEVRPPPMCDAERQEWSLEAHCRAHTYVSDGLTCSKRILEKEPVIVPASESLKDVNDRVMPLWNMAMAPRLLRGETLLVVAHANTCKAMLYFLDNQIVTKESFNTLKIPSALPLVYEFEEADIEDKSAHIVPGNLKIIPPETSALIQKKNSDLRFQLSAHWIETSEIDALQFCSAVGEENLESEIA